MTTVVLVLVALWFTVLAWRTEDQYQSVGLLVLAQLNLILAALLRIVDLLAK